jgi:hypothetical protein
MSIPYSGNIQATSLAAILEGLRQTKATGTLTLHNRGMVKYVYFKAGQIVFAASTDINDRLGEVLIKCCKLSREHLEHALRLSKKSAGLKKLGALLVENGFVTPKELFIGLKTQVKDIIYSLFLWAEGDYRFEEQVPSDIILLQINIKELIAEIIQRIKQEA